MISLPLLWGVIYTLLDLSGLILRINDSGLFPWISLTALSRTYFIALMRDHIFVQKAATCI